MNSSPTEADFARAARRAAHGLNSLLAPLMSAWEHVFPDSPATEALGCPEQVVVSLALCLRPRKETWVQDVAEISGVLGLDAARLERFIRAGEVAERLAHAHSADAVLDGRLLAAQDRDEEI